MFSWLINVLYYWLLGLTGIYQRMKETARQPAIGYALAHPLTDASLKTWRAALERARKEGLALANDRYIERAKYTRFPDYYLLFADFYKDVCLVAWRNQLNQCWPDWREQWKSQVVIVRESEGA